VIVSYEVGAIFKIIDEASPALRKMLGQIRELRLALDKVKASMAEVGAFKPPAGIGTAIGETNELATSWGRVTAEARAARAAMTQAATAARGAASFPPAAGGGGGGNRGVFRPGARGGAYGGAGAHVGGPGLPVPGGGHVRFGGGAMAAAGLLGYGVVEAAQMEDAVWQLTYHSGQEQNDTSHGRFRKILQDSMSESGYSIHDIAESAKQEIRMFQGTPGGGLDVLPEMLRAATIESRLKGESPEESMKALIGLAHMTKQYSPEAIKKLAPAFAFLSTANPSSLSSIERAAGYAVPLLQSGLEVDPMQSLLLGTALTRAGATNTKSGTWLREMALRAMPGTSMMSKLAYKKHEEALREVGLVDDQHKPTWFSDGKPDLLKMLDIAGANAAKIPVERRAAVERGLFGAQGGGGFALLADPAVREQILSLQKEMNSPEFKARYSGFSEAYAKGSTMQNARTAMADFNVTMMDLGKDVLPTVNRELKDFRGILSMIRDIIPHHANPSTADKGTPDLMGQAVTGMLRNLGLAGNPTTPAKPGGNFMQNYFNQPGGSPLPSKDGKPAEPKVLQQNTTIQLNIDGRALGEVVASKLVDLMKFDTSSPAFNGTSLFGP
jgi:hypothetical protein